MGICTYIVYFPFIKNITFQMLGGTCDHMGKKKEKKGEKEERKN